MADAPVTAAPVTAATVVTEGTAAPAKTTAPVAPETYEVKVDGKTVKMSLDELKKNAGLGKKAYSNLEEAAKIRSDADAKLDRIKTPKAALQYLTDPSNGYKANEVREAFEEWYKETYIDPEGMTPEQKRIAELERENKKFKETQAERESREKAEREAEMDRQGSEQLQKELTVLLEESGLPKTKFTASRLAYWMRVNESKGINAPKEMIIEQVRIERNNIVKSMADSCDGEALVQALGEDVVKKIRQYDLKKIRERRGISEPQAKEDDIFDKDKPREKISLREVRERARQFK